MQFGMPHDIHAKRRGALVALIKTYGSIRALADKTGTDPAHLSQIKNGVREMGEAVARRIENALHLGHGTLDLGLWKPDDEPPVERGAGAVPVVGTAQLGDAGYWHELQYPVGHGDGFVRYPSRDPNVYALRVKGDSMRPRIKPGEFIVVEPAAATPAGEEVLVTTEDGRSMVKILGPRRDGMVELQSINEDHRPITLDETQIKTMHFVAAIVKASRYYREG